VLLKMVMITRKWRRINIECGLEMFMHDFDSYPI
jgi:hypothetical protein